MVPSGKHNDFPEQSAAGENFGDLELEPLFKSIFFKGLAFRGTLQSITSAWRALQLKGQLTHPGLSLEMAR